MQRRITSNISVISAFAVAISGLCAEQALAGGSDCRTGSVVKVCVSWSQEADPEEGSDYKVDFTDASNPAIQLVTADDAWNVHAELVSGGAPANIGSLTLDDPAPSGEDFEVTIANGTGAGAANVGTIDLDDVGFTGYSTIEGGKISGNLTGGLTLVQDSGSNGGEITFTIEGDVSGAISVPVALALWIKGTLSADIDVTSVIRDGSVLLDGPVSSGVDITIADMVNGVLWNNPASEFAADITMSNGVPSGSGVAIHSDITSHVTFDFNDADLAGNFVCKLETDADFVNGGDITGTLHIGRGDCFGYVGAMTFDSISSAGKISLGPCVDLDGTISITGNMEGDITIDGDVLSTRSISVTGDVTGDIAIDGDMDGSITVVGALANADLLGGGRIMVAGESSGPIKVGENTGSLTLIQVSGGLASGATIEVNTTEGNYDADGEIHVGPTITPEAIPFDGCIRIYDGSSGGGDLNNDLTVIGCHDDNEKLNICIDGDDNGNVSLVQTGCTYQTATWSCETCP